MKYGLQLYSIKNISERKDFPQRSKKLPNSAMTALNLPDFSVLTQTP